MLKTVKSCKTWIAICVGIGLIDGFCGCIGMMFVMMFCVVVLLAEMEEVKKKEKEGDKK